MDDHPVFELETDGESVGIGSEVFPGVKKLRIYLEDEKGNRYSLQWRLPIEVHLARCGNVRVSNFSGEVDGSCDRLSLQDCTNTKVDMVIAAKPQIDGSSVVEVTEYDR